MTSDQINCHRTECYSDEMEEKLRISCNMQRDGPEHIFAEPCTMEGLAADQINCSTAWAARSSECDRGEKMQPMLENWALIPH